MLSPMPSTGPSPNPRRSGGGHSRNPSGGGGHSRNPSAGSLSDVTSRSAFQAAQQEARRLRDEAVRHSAEAEVASRQAAHLLRTTYYLLPTPDC